MEAVVNTIILSSLFIFSCIVTYVISTTLTRWLYSTSSSVTYKVGDMDDYYIVYRVDPDGRPYWRILESEIPKEEPEEEKIRIPMIKFEDIPFGEVGKYPLPLETKEIDISDLFVCQEQTMKEIEIRNPTITGTLIYSPSDVKVEKKILIPTNNFIKEHEELQLELHSMVMSPEMRHDYLRYKDDFFMLLKLRESWVRRREEKFTHGGIALRDPCRIMMR